MINNFLDHLRAKGFSPYTLGAYSVDLNAFANYIAINPQSTLQQWKNTLQGKPASINRKIAAVKSYYKWANKSGLLAINPAKDIHFKRKAHRLPKFIPNLVIPDNIPVQHKIILSLLAETGIRLAELCTLTTNNVTDKQIKVTGKGNKERIIPISPKMAALLSEVKQAALLSEEKSAPLLSGSEILLSEEKSAPLLSGSEILLSEEKSPAKKSDEILLFGLSRTQVQYLCKKHLGCFPHTLRHSFATTLINAGAPLLSIRDLLGHESIATTQVYTSLDIDRLKAIHQKCHPKH